MEGFKKKEILYVCLLAFSLIFFGVSVVNAASLYFSPSSGSYAVSQGFGVSVYVSSTEQAMNAASGTISFPQDKLQVVSISKTGSIFNLWVQEPTFSNSTGTITFEGIVLNPGFQGSAGKIITANFKGKAAGSASLTFSSGSVLANDGKGTNILASLGSGTYTILFTGITPPPEEEEEIIPTPTLGVPLAPQISSLTHLDPEKWYSNNDPEFSWQLPSDVTKVSYAIDKNPNTNPKFIAETLIDKVSFSDMEDSIWYFHINFKNQHGWGKFTHRKVLIDTQPPEPFKIIIDKKDLFDPSPILHFETTDSLSGMEYYEVKMGDREQIKTTLADLERNPFQLPAQGPGKHSIEVKAFDKAENYTSAFTEIEVLPIETPVINKYPKRLNVGEKAILEGKSLPEATILVFIGEKGKEPIMEETKADSEGNWAFTSKPLEKGSYEAWVQAKDKRGALSLPSEKVSFEVDLPPFLKFGTMAISYLVIMITLIVLIAVAVAVIVYVWYRISLWRKRVRTETKEVAQAVLGAFKALREEVQEQIEYLDGKPGLTPSEEKVRDKLKEAIEISEKFIEKEIKDIEKELE